MEQEQECLVNKLMRRIERLEAETNGKQQTLEQLRLEPFDAAIGAPDDLARRVARNTQLLLQEESHVARVTDPAGGSYYLEHLTDQLVEAAWAEMQRMESDGGLAAALIDGSLAARYGEVRAVRDLNVARRLDAITGVSEFPNLGEAPVERPPDDVSALRAKAAGVRPETVGPATTCEPLGVYRVAAPFEELRDASDEMLAAMGPEAKKIHEELLKDIASVK